MKVLNKVKIFSMFLILSGTLQASWVGYHGNLSVSGAKVVDEYGNPVNLRGMSFYWSVWGGDAYYQSETVEWLVSDWKVNIVRASMAVDVGGGYVENAGYQTSLVKAVVDAAIDQGIYVLIDFHSHNANNYTDQAKTFFREMAQTYGEYPNVIYELFNEPVDQDWPTIKNYAIQVIDEIRKYDPDNIIVVGTSFYSQKVHEAAADPIERDNIVYTLHFYANTHPFETESDWQPATWGREALAAGLPMMITEFGTCDASGDGSYNLDQAGKWLDWADQNDIGYCKWSVHNLGESSAILESGSGGYSGWTADQLKGSAEWYMSRLRSSNGDAPDDSSVTGSMHNTAANRKKHIKTRYSGGSLYINMPKDDELSCRIYNAAGALIYRSDKQTFFAGKNTLSIKEANLPCGMYLMELKPSSSSRKINKSFFIAR